MRSDLKVASSSLNVSCEDAYTQESQVSIITFGEKKESEKNLYLLSASAC